MKTTDFHSTTRTKLERIAWLSAGAATKTFEQLMHHVNVESLRECYDLLKKDKAAGIDGVTKEEYGEHLEANLGELVTKMKRMGYRPSALRRVEIPKPGQPGKHRPLGISNFEDKLVQKQFQRLLEAIYEPLFLGSSYGFRRGLGCHDAVSALIQHLYRERVVTVIDVDLDKFFDSISHEILEGLLRRKIKDERFIRYIIRMFKAGVLVKGELQLSDEGIAQGSCVSPVLANILAHYVIDEWFEETVKSHCKGKVELFRYSDDLVICCESSTDANRVKEALVKRLSRFRLKINEEKTKLVYFDYQQNRRGTFSFLGFTFYWGKSRNGNATPKVKTEGKRLRSKLKKVNEWAKSVRHKGTTQVIWKSFCKKLRGHIQYYGVSHNSSLVSTFIHQAKKIMYYWLNRRSQKQSFNWEQFKKFVEKHPTPKVKVYHRLF